MQIRHKSTYLSIQITQAERQILHRKRLIGERASMLGQSARRQLTSPTMLLVAGSIGFAVGYLPVQTASTPESAEHPRASRSKLFERALKLITLARILSKAFPSAQIVPSAQSGVPVQTPTPRYRSAAA